MEARQPRAVQARIADTLASNYFSATDHGRLYKSTFVPSPNSTLADFDANRVAAADVADIVMAGIWLPGLDNTGRALLIYSTLLDFVPVDPGATFPIIVGGMYMRIGVGAILLAYFAFDGPVTLETLADHLLVKPFIYMDALTDEDAEFIAGP